MSVGTKTLTPVRRRKGVSHDELVAHWRNPHARAFLTLQYSRGPPARAPEALDIAAAAARLIAVMGR